MLVEECKQILPKKAVREDHPQLYFVAPLKHKNFMDNEARTILFNCMEATVWQTKYINVRLVKIKEVWDFKNNDLVNDHGHLQHLV